MVSVNSKRIKLGQTTHLNDLFMSRLKMLKMSNVQAVQVRARLVVLSCVYSAQGKITPEGVVGIGRAFLGAGARSVLVSCSFCASLWKASMNIWLAGIVLVWLSTGLWNVFESQRSIVPLGPVYPHWRWRYDRIRTKSVRIFCVPFTFGWLMFDYWFGQKFALKET